jgi:inhibitor of cysteine peptidase
MKNSKLPLAIGVLALALFGPVNLCKAQAPGSTSDAGPTWPVQSVITTLNESSSGTTFTAAVGQLIEIVLQENGTTGYSWNKVSIGDPVWKLLDETTVYPSQLIGAGGTRHYLFRAVQAGSGAIQLTYNRSWETGVAPAETYTLNLTVVEAGSRDAVSTISQLSANTVPPGSAVSLKGVAFVPTMSVVLIDGQAVSSFFMSPTEGLFVVPSDAKEGAHQVTVNTDGIAGSAATLTVSDQAAATTIFGSATLAGDMDGDGQITLKDAVLLLRKVVGL